MLCFFGVLCEGVVSGVWLSCVRVWFLWVLCVWVFWYVGILVFVCCIFLCVCFLCVCYMFCGMFCLGFGAVGQFPICYVYMYVVYCPASILWICQRNGKGSCFASSLCYLSGIVNFCCCPCCGSCASYSLLLFP